jgi:DNA topoisomerase-2
MSEGDLDLILCSTIHQINDQTMDSFKVTIDKENNVISVFNNGRGIPIEIHSKEKIWIPELIFGNLCVEYGFVDPARPKLTSLGIRLVTG